MVSKFDSIKPLNGNLFEIGKSIENQLESSPSAVLCEGTTFLDNIVLDIANRENINFDSADSFSSKCDQLFDLKIINRVFKDYLMNAYVIRDKMHEEVTNAEMFFESNKKRALSMYFLLLKCATSYKNYLDSKNVVPDDFKVRRAKQKARTRERLIKGTNFDNLKPLEVENCVLCGKPAVENSIYCEECNAFNNFVKQLDKLVMKIGFYNTFYKDDLIKIGYSDEEAEDLLKRLTENNLTLSVLDGYQLNRANVNVFKDEFGVLDEMEKVARLYFADKLNLLNIMEYDPYLKGEDGIDSYVGFYKLIYEDALEEFLERFDSNKNIKTILNSTKFPHDYYNKFLAERTYDKINEKFDKEYLQYKKDNLNNAEVKKRLFLIKPFFQDIKNGVNRVVKDRVYEDLLHGKSLEQAMEDVNISQRYLDDLAKEEWFFRNDINNVYKQRLHISKLHRPEILYKH